MIYALYDEDDFIFGVFDRDQLKELLNTTNKTFNCIVSRLKSGKHKMVTYNNRYYRVYIYKEGD